MGRREKSIITNINSDTVDIIRLKVSVSNQSIYTSTKSVELYSKYLNINYYNLNNELRKRKISIASIIKNQLCNFKMDKGISILSILKKDKDNSIMEIDEDEYSDIELLDTSIITLEIDVKKFIESILNLELIDEKLLWNANEESLITYKCNSILTLLYELQNTYNKNSSVFQNGFKPFYKRKNMYNYIINNSYMNKLKEIVSLKELSLDYLYQIIIFYTSILFAHCMLRIYSLRPTEVFLSTNLKDKIDIKTIHSVLDYSQASMDIISGVLNYNYKDNVSDILKDAIHNFHHNIIPVGFRLENNYNNSFGDNLFIDYRGLYKPHGNGYLDAGYSFFKLSGTYETYDYAKYEKRNQLGVYLNPIEYIKRFSDKTQPNSIIFTCTVKIKSLREGLFNVVNKSYIAFNTKSNDDIADSVQIIDSIYIKVNDLFTIIDQLCQATKWSNQYRNSIDSSSKTYFSLEYLIVYTIQRLFIDPIKVLIKGVKSTNNIIEFNIRKTVSYFISQPIEQNNFINITNCIESIDNLIKRYQNTNLIDSSYDYKKYLPEKYTIKDIIETLTSINEIQIEDKVYIEFVDNLMIIIASLIPVTTVFIDSDKENKSIIFLIRLLYSYIKSPLFKLKESKSNHRFYRLIRFVSKLLYRNLFNKGYIDEIDYITLTETRDMSIVHNKEIELKVYNNLYQNIKDNAVKLCICLNDSLKCEDK